ncbi:MAG: TrbC/VirB2 family protein [Cetobacterium sp.]
MKKIIFSLMAIFWNITTFASKNSKMVWETPAEEIQQSISGPMAKFLALVVIAVSAFGWVITDNSSIMGKAIKIVLALSIIGGAAVLLGLFGISGGVVIG